ncbi:HAMP domain-containing histidine kinase [Patescibacteria group bacterium]|nr:HAMP domain-containing histidine kinase [Patescibacteria group bacterium]
MKLSLTWRLSIWYILAFTVAIFFILTIVYLDSLRITYKYIDEFLTTDGLVAAQAAIQQDLIGGHLVDNQTFQNKIPEKPGELLFLLNNNGKIVVSSLYSSADTQAISHLFTVAQNSKGNLFVEQNFNHTLIRFYLIPLRENHKFFGILLIGHPVDDVQKSFHNLLILLVVIFLLLTLLTIISGYLVTKLGLRPFKKISSQIQQINPLDPREKLIVPGNNDELSQLTISFNNLIDRIHSILKREQQFMADVAHELKTPLTILQSNLELALSHPRSSGEYRQIISESLHDAQTISSLTKEILDLSWSEVENDHLSLKAVDLSKLAFDLVDIAHTLSSVKNIKTHSSITPKVFILGRYDKLHRALLNVVENAVKYSPKNKLITINLQTTKNTALIVIADHGVGIPPQDLPYIFNRFYRGRQSPEIPGSGLGLSITKGVIEAHHGAISIYSRVAFGTSVTISLPLLKKLPPSSVKH